VGRFDRGEIGRLIKKYPGFAGYRHPLEKFYSGRDFQYAWYDQQGLIPQAERLYHRIMNAESEGLPGTMPYTQELADLFNSGPQTLNKPDPQTELFLTASYFKYASMVWGGIPEKETRSLDWFLPRKKLDLPALMDSMLSGETARLIRSGFVYKQYDRLRTYLKQYRSIDSLHDWPAIKPPKKPFALGDSSQQIALLRKKLYMLGDLPGITSGSGGSSGANIESVGGAGRSSGAVFDTALTAAIRRFQLRMGLSDDGVAGPGTIRELNLPIAARIRQILVNMERYRWVPTNIGRDYLIVNIPGFLLYVLDKDSVLFSMRAVVGKKVHETKIFNGDIKYVVFSPYWNVPPDIMKNEVLPAIRKDPRYLKKHDMEWAGNTVRQRPGDENPLGLVKFLFPNKYNIYLHDSPAKHLFNEETRAFSHGCIRLADARKLAEYLLRNDPKWPADKIDEAMHSGKETWVTMPDPVPVFIGYFTAWTDKAGYLHFGKDIYHKDAPLYKLLYKGKSQTTGSQPGS
jgi:murein L,D-transpeptidase YcbB/YkuD